MGETVKPRIDEGEMLYVLLQEVQTLPERYQTPLVMRYFEGLSRRAIAEQTDSTVGQIQGTIWPAAGECCGRDSCGAAYRCRWRQARSAIRRHRRRQRSRRRGLRALQRSVHHSKMVRAPRAGCRRWRLRLLKKG